MSQMIPLAIPNVGEAEARNLQACVDENMVSSIGRFVSQLEEDVARRVGAAAAVATSAGTTGLHAALHVVGVAPGDLVICPSFTFFATAGLAGAFTDAAVLPAVGLATAAPFARALPWLLAKRLPFAVFLSPLPMVAPSFRWCLRGA